MRPPKTAVLFLLGVGVGFAAARSLPTVARAAPPRDQAAVGSIVVQNAYFPKPGMDDQVLETRLAASAVRREHGLSVGRVLRVVEGPEGAPLLIWEAEYADAAAREADVAALAETDFSRVSSHMGTLLDGSSRTVFEVVEGPR